MVDKYPLLLEERLKVLLEYGNFLAEATERMGIVARGDRDRLFGKHVCESLAPELVEALPKGARILDVGAGGGLPGIPLAIVRPDLSVTLLEPREKKVSFLERVKLRLRLPNVDVRAGRLEDVALASGDPGESRTVAGSETAMLDDAAPCVGSPRGKVEPGRPPWDIAVARSVSWNKAMIRALRECVKKDGVLIRYGARELSPAIIGEPPAAVRLVPLEGSDPRALQFWPPTTWDRLTEAR